MVRQLVITLLLINLCCSSSATDSSQIVDAYYKTYAERSDFEKFLSFYDSTIVLEDMIFGERIEGIEDFRAFFD